MLWWLPYIVLSCEFPSQTGVPEGGVAGGDQAQRDAAPGPDPTPKNKITCDDLITTLNISVDPPLPNPDGERRKLDVHKLELVNSQCHYPCKCKNFDPNCKGGVSIVKDGCDCCFMCARQQGDLCDYKDKCDEDKGLYCDMKLEGGIRGICRAEKAKSCEVDGKDFRDGEQFKPNCSQLCTCQNGQYACSSLCPQEEHAPSSVHCKEPQLVAITGKCCKEWVCPHAHSLPGPGDDNSSPERGHSNNPPCRRESAPWSACSVTCGMGVSMRVTNDNEDCQPVQEQRLCLVRPCSLNDDHMTGKSCKSTWRHEASHMKYNGCESVEEYRPKFCSTCKKRKCCGPDKTKSIPMDFRCPDGKSFSESFMWIRNCKCKRCRSDSYPRRFLK